MKSLRTQFLLLALAFAPALAFASTGTSTCAGSLVPTAVSGCVDPQSIYVTSGQAAQDLSSAQSIASNYAGIPPAMGGTQTASSVGNASYPASPGPVGLIFGGTGAKQQPFSDLWGIKIQPTGSSIGTLTVPYAMALGSGSGACTYTILPVTSANAGSAYDLTGSCTTPGGQTFDSTGTLAALGAPGTYKMSAGFGQYNGWWATMGGSVSLLSGSVSSVSVTSASDPAGQIGVTLAVGAPGAVVTAGNPYAQTATSVLIPMHLSDGSTCQIVANAWAGSANKQYLLAATCQTAKGQSYTLYGSAAPDWTGLYAFQLHGVGAGGTSVGLSGNYDPSTKALTGSGNTDMMNPAFNVLTGLNPATQVTLSAN